MADCPIFAPQPARMPADRLGLRSNVKRNYEQAAADRQAGAIDGEFNRLTTYYGCATITFASLADSASIAFNIPVHGPLFGTHYAVRVFVSIDLDGLSMSGYVSADDRVTVVFQNDTGAAVQPASSFDVCVAVERFPAGQDSISALTVTGGVATGDFVITPPIGLGQLVLTGYAPTVTATSGHHGIAPETGSLVLTGYAPTVSKTDNVIIAGSGGITPANLVLTGYQPTVVNTAYGDAAYFDTQSFFIKRTSGLSGATNTKKVTFVFDIRMDSGSASSYTIFTNHDGTTTIPLFIQRRDTGKFRVWNLGAGFRFDTVGTYADDGSWREVMCSFDLTEGTSTNCHLYIDGVSDLTISEFTDVSIQFGSSTASSIGQSFVGCLKNFQLWIDEYLDLGVGSNETDLRNRDIGATPLIHLDMNGELASAFLVNQGTGGNYTEDSGTIKVCSSAP